MAFYLVPRLLSATLRQLRSNALRFHTGAHSLWNPRLSPKFQVI
jgi:hypothetical protein